MAKMSLKPKSENDDSKTGRRTRVVKKKVILSPAEKGKLSIEEGTVQRRAAGKGVDFIPKKNPATNKSDSKDKIVDPKSKKKESESQKNLRKYAVDAHMDKNVDLSKRYKEGDYITYQTKKGAQVAGRVKKGPDTPEISEEVEEKQVKVTKKQEVANKYKDSSGKPILNSKDFKKRKMELKSQGYSDSPAQGNYMLKNKESKWVSEADVDKAKSEGYHAEDPNEQKKKRKLEDGTQGVNTGAYSKGTITNKNPKLGEKGKKVPYHNYLKDGKKKMKLNMGSKNC